MLRVYGAAQRRRPPSPKPPAIAPGVRAVAALRAFRPSRLHAYPAGPSIGLKFLEAGATIVGGAPNAELTDRYPTRTLAHAPTHAHKSARTQIRTHTHTRSISIYIADWYRYRHIYIVNSNKTGRPVPLRFSPRFPVADCLGAEAASRVDGTASLAHCRALHRLVALEKENRVLAFNAQEGRELLAVGTPRGPLPSRARCHAPLRHDVMRPFVMI